MLIDEINITFKAGRGGDGKASFFPGKKAGPSGGDGGDGGSFYIEGSTNVKDLNEIAGKRQISASNGEAGGNNQKTGRKGADLTLKLPLGSLLVNQNKDETYELLEDGQKILICKGGRRGRGNHSLRSSANTTPKVAEKGQYGEEKHFQIKVRMIADFGLIGLPNAGKSSLLNELTQARAEVGNYAFTTLEPNLGVYKGKVIADIPGLIEGASSGKGLGVNFLKHIEKVKLLIHCISSEEEDVVGAYKTIMNELENFNPEIAQKEQIVLLTKSDLIEKDLLDKKIKELKKLQKKVYPVSVLDNKSIEELKKQLT